MVLLIERTATRMRQIDSRPTQEVQQLVCLAVRKEGSCARNLRCDALEDNVCAAWFDHLFARPIGVRSAETMTISSSGSTRPATGRCAKCPTNVLRARHRTCTIRPKCFEKSPVRNKCRKRWWPRRAHNGVRVGVGVERAEQIMGRRGWVEGGEGRGGGG
jgi:hypothetical protein